MQIPTIVINLDRRKDRYEEFLTTFKGKKHIRFSAIDGRSIILNKNLSYFEQSLLKKIAQSRVCPDYQVPGVFGCWLSHFFVWEQLVNDKENDFYLIVEDDLRISSNFFDVFSQVSVDLPSECDLCYLGGRFVPSFLPSNMKNWEKILSGKSYFYKTNPNNVGRDYDRGLFCYILTKPGAKKLTTNAVKDVYSDDKKILAVDEWIYKNRSRYNLMEVLPHISWSPANYKSDIR